MYILHACVAYSTANPLIQDTNKHVTNIYQPPEYVRAHVALTFPFPPPHPSAVPAIRRGSTSFVCLPHSSVYHNSGSHIKPGPTQSTKFRLWLVRLGGYLGLTCQSDPLLLLFLYYFIFIFYRLQIGGRKIQSPQAILESEKQAGSWWARASPVVSAVSPQ